MRPGTRQSRRHPEAVDLGVLDGMHVLFIAQHPAPQRSLPKRLEVPARHTPISRKALLAELDELRRTGLGYDREEHRAGICGVGVAITDLDGSSASISVPVPAARFHGASDTVATALLEARDEVQMALQSG